MLVCDSERAKTAVIHSLRFLSCLCGSEHADGLGVCPPGSGIHPIQGHVHTGNAQNGGIEVEDPEHLLVDMLAELAINTGGPELFQSLSISLRIWPVSIAFLLY